MNKPKDFLDYINKEPKGSKPAKKSGKLRVSTIKKTPMGRKLKFGIKISKDF